MYTKIRHGLGEYRKTAEHRAWSAMRQRCRNPKNKLYYGRVKICERWNSYENFLADMGRKPTPQHTLDRIDPNGHYEPGNCRWATVEEQANNKRINVRYEINGRSLTMAQWAREYGFTRQTLRARILSGLTIEEAVRRPVA